MCFYDVAVLEKQCDELMTMKYGKLVDLEALQTRTGNRVLEELKQEKLVRETTYAKEIKQWDVSIIRQYKELYIIHFIANWCVCAYVFYANCDVCSKQPESPNVCNVQGKVEDAHQKLMDMTRANTERQLSMRNLLEQKRNLEQKFNTRQKKMVIFILYSLSTKAGSH